MSRSAIPQAILLFVLTSPLAAQIGPDQRDALRLSELFVLATDLGFLSQPGDDPGFHALDDFVTPNIRARVSQRIDSLLTAGGVPFTRVQPHNFPGLRVLRIDHRCRHTGSDGRSAIACHGQLHVADPVPFRGVTMLAISYQLDWLVLVLDEIDLGPEMYAAVDENLQQFMEDYWAVNPKR
jgi:hypothetical protein